MKRKVLFIQQRLPVYRVPFFDGLRCTLESAGIELLLVHGSATAAEAKRADGGNVPWALPVETTYFHVGRTQVSTLDIHTSEYAGADVVVLPHAMSLLNLYQGMALRRFSRYRLALFGHGRNFQGSPTGPGPWIRSRVARFSDAYFAYTARSTEAVLRTGYPKEQIIQVDNAVDSTAIRHLAGSLSSEARRRTLAELGLRGRRVGVYVGSLYSHKLIPLLLRSADLIREQIGDFEFIIIGDGPQKHLVDEFASVRPWVAALGPVHGPEKAVYGCLGHVFLNPGLVGLGILDGFAMGMPMATTDGALHSPEIAYLEDGSNGIISATHEEDFSTAVVQLLKDEQTRLKMVQRCIQTSEHYSLERMIERFAGGLIRLVS